MTRIPSTLTDPECNALLFCLSAHKQTNISAHNAARNTLMCLTMLDAGVRVGELVQLRVSDYLEGGQIVHSLVIRSDIAKRNIERVIPMTDRLHIETRKMTYYWGTYPATYAHHYAFTTLYPRDHLTVRQVQRILTIAGKTTRGRRIYPHELRHTFASRLMRKTNLRVVQQLLGHKSIQTTQIYTHPNSTDLKEAIDSLNTNNATPPKKTLENAETSVDAR